MTHPIKFMIKSLPGIRGVVAQRDKLISERDTLVIERNNFVSQRDNLVSELDKLRPYAPEHYDSPIPSLAEVRKDETKLFGRMPRRMRGIDLAESKQLTLLETLLPYYEAMPFTPFKTDSLRYYFENDWYSYSDAIVLHCMMRHLKPRTIIEVGSGFSSCVMLDTNERFFKNLIKMTLIEPRPERLYSLLKPHDKGSIRLLEQRLQDVSINIFEELQANDILFVDSTHVSKIGSDVNHLFFNILPRLPSGVNIHFHDIFYPFEYPREWIYGGRAWNELYILRAFLEYNSEFEIVLFNTFMEKFYEQFFREKMPLCLKNRGGSVWLRRR
jgi:Methyltransferase domain